MPPSRRAGLDHLDLMISRSALAKEHGGHASIEAADRGDRASGRGPPGPSGAARTDAQLIADLAEGYDVCVIGADKWHQLHDLAFYDGLEADRDAALGRLPMLAVAPRHGVAVPATRRWSRHPRRRPGVPRHLVDRRARRARRVARLSSCRSVGVRGQDDPHER